jgi:zinc protease
LEHLNTLELSSLQRIHQVRFGNFADFTFLFVRDFSDDLLKEYCKTYLATLPVSKAKDKIEAQPFAPLSGFEQVSFQKGSNESAHVVHVTSGYL